MPVRDLANSDVVTAGRDTEVTELSQQMNDQQVGSIIIGEDDKPIGIVTDRTIALAVGQEDDVTSLTAEDVMSENPATVRGDVEAYDLTTEFGDAKVRRLPVVNEDGSLKGIVSLDDLVAISAEQLEEAAKVIEEQSPGYAPDER